MPPYPLSRRRFLRAGALGLTGLAAGCLNGPTEGARPGTARLHARPGTATASLTPGRHELDDDIGSEATLYVPTTWTGDNPADLFVMLHGAGASRDLLDAVFEIADPFGVMVLLPKSSGRTWDLVLGGFGADVIAIDRALEWIFARCTVDPATLTLGGFSDGASYALSLGLGNGDLFRHLAAFSPGFLAPPERIGTPSIFMAHGTQDGILPIDDTSRRIAQQLRGWSYELEYREFEGDHVIRRVDMEHVLSWISA